MAFTPSFHDLAHLGHLELLTPKPEKSLAFFTKIVGLHESGRSSNSVYLRAWGDYERASLKLTAAKTSGLGHVAFRTRSEQVLTQLVEHLSRQSIEGETGLKSGRRVPDFRPGLAANRLGSGGTSERPSVGPTDRTHLSHVRHPAPRG